jgi:hypothetical protein
MMESYQGKTFLDQGSKYRNANAGLSCALDLRDLDGTNGQEEFSEPLEEEDQGKL